MRFVAHRERGGLTRPSAYTLHFAVASVLLVAVLLVAAPVKADILPNYVITGVPDLDQKRDQRIAPFRKGLPANDSGKCTGDPTIDCTEDADCGFDEPCLGTGGAMYCFPTSAVIWAAYLANHGYPQVAPGPAADWQSMDVYNQAGDAIE